MSALVVGGGLAGAALAIRLAEAGRPVTVIERSSGPHHKVCGEFLSREAELYLASLGLNPRSLGAVPIRAVRLAIGARNVAVPLPFAASSLSRYALDEALLARAEAAGAIVHRGCKVVDLTRDDGTWSARLADGRRLDGDAAFLATGKHDLRAHKRRPGLQNDLVAFKMHWRLAAKQRLELDEHVDLVAFPGGYAGLEPIEDGRANLCLVIRRERLQQFGQRWDQLLAGLCNESAHLTQRLDGAVPGSDRPLALSAIPYGHVHRVAQSDSADVRELWRLGDQAVVIPSFSGDGMSIALHSAELAAKTFLCGGDARAYQSRLARDVEKQVLLATAISQGLVRSSLQNVIGTAASLWPGLVRAVAFHTRVPDDALAFA